jgi:hypothetical protein
MNDLSSHLQSLAAAASISNISGTYNPDYIQMIAYGFDVNNNPIRVSLVSLSDPTQLGRPYLNVYNRLAKAWGPDTALPNPDGLNFKAVSAITGPNDTSYIILLSNTGNVYIIQQEIQDQNWTWYGQLIDPNNNTFRWITTGIGNQNNVQVVLLTSDNTPFLFW